VTYFCSIGSQILYIFETHGLGQTPSSLERYLVHSNFSRGVLTRPSLKIHVVYTVPCLLQSVSLSFSLSVCSPVNTVTKAPKLTVFQHMCTLVDLTNSQWRRQLWGTGVRAPSTSNNFILVHFGVHLRANYPNIVLSAR